ncbi:hypothetical protein [Streptomyces chrestomyceticus]|uniref:hypothetical protein n=1 Tax=Streptomyces chrestomyceticus TaxID=68185 RepID=UPI0019CFB163|nr:hypothetical protein [Streptomyces chrestomyceticus]
MTARREVEELVNEGMPSEDAPLEEIEKAERLLESIIPPVTDEEAQMLATAFGPDGCYGLASSLMHVIETAPGAGTASYSQDADNWWVQRLNARVAAGREIAETGHDATCPDHMGGQGRR